MPEPVPAPRLRHQGPPLGWLATLYTVFFCTGLWFVTIFSGRPYYPGPWEPASTIVAFFQARPDAAERCAFFHFGAAIVLGLFTACIANQMRFLGVRAAGVNIALFGGFATALNMMGGAATMWAMAQPGIARDPGVIAALYYLSFALGGVGFSAPLGLLMAGISIPALFLHRLPRWVGVLGIVLGVCGELSWLNLLFPKMLFLIPLTRFPGFVWLVAAGFLLPNTLPAAKNSAAETAAAF